MDHGGRGQDRLHRSGLTVGERVCGVVQRPFARRALDGEIFYTMREAQIIIESWRRHFNMVRPHGSIGYRPPAPEVFVPAFAAWPATLTRPAPPAMLPVAKRPTLN